MEKFSVEQLESINQNRLHLESQCQGDVTPETLARALTELCPAVDYEEHLAHCQDLQAGIGHAQKICDDLPSPSEKRCAEEILNRITESMSESQCKGFYLQCFESFRMSDLERGNQDANLVDSPELATLSKAELQAVLLEQIQNMSASLAAEGLASFPHTGTLTGDLDTKSSASTEDILLLAASVYAAGVNGDLPQSFEQYPELLGACLAAESCLTKDFCLEDCSGDGLAERILEVVAGVLVIAAAVAGCVLGVMATEAVFLVLGSGWLGVIAGTFTFAGIALLTLYGVGMAVAAALDAIKEKIKSNTKNSYVTLPQSEICTTNATEDAYDAMPMGDGMDHEEDAYAPA